MENINISTKQQERAVLNKIRELVTQLGPGSHLAATFECCFELATESIDNDWTCPMGDRVRRAKCRVAELEDKLAESEKDFQAAREAAHIIAEQKDAEIAELKAKLNQAQEDTRRFVRYRDESATAAGEATRRAEAAEAEVIRLKAKLYDLMVAAK